MGKPKMSREELRVVLVTEGPFCGCGSPEDACQAILDLLRIHPLHEHQKELAELAADPGQTMLLLYLLDSMELTEHGGTVEGGWLSPKGEAVKEALEAELDDYFEALTDNHCIHGHDIDDVEHDCMKAGEPKPWRPKVYVLETGVYAERGVFGVFDSAEEAMQARPQGNWSESGEGCWVNDLDMDAAAVVTEYEVEKAPDA